MNKNEIGENQSNVQGTNHLNRLPLWAGLELEELVRQEDFRHYRLSDFR